MSVECNAPVDPRVQVELEKLNSATDNINKYEVELDESKCEFKRLLAESVVRMKQAAHKLGNSIEAAKPYYESRIYAAQLAKETQQAAIQHEKAKSMHAAAKEMVYLAEQGLGEKSTLDTACQEMLTHAAGKVNQSQLEVTETRNALKMCQLKLEVATNRVGKLQGQLRQALRASRPYYETRANYNGILKAQKLRINELETKVADAKLTYNEALKSLEQISEEIHRQRQLQQSKQHFGFDAAQSCAKMKGRDDDDDGLTADTAEELTTRRQRKADCQHFLHDFDTILTFPEKITCGMHKSVSTGATAAGSDADFVQTNNLHCAYDIKSQKSEGTSARNADSSDFNDIEQWTEIRLSHSESTSSSYSNQSLLHEQQIDAQDDDYSPNSSASSTDEPKRKVTCTTIFQDSNQTATNRKQSLSQWLTRSNSFKSSVASRRQSFDLLIDAGDKVKDVFSYGFQKVGRTLERRNSESEMNREVKERNSTGEQSTALLGSTTTDFFIFSRTTDPKDLLSDEQIENLLLNHAIDEHGVIIVDEPAEKTPSPSVLERVVTGSSNVGGGGVSGIAGAGAVGSGGTTISNMLIF